jgi:hypothetical protein
MLYAVYHRGGLVPYRVLGAALRIIIVGGLAGGWGTHLSYRMLDYSSRRRCGS